MAGGPARRSPAKAYGEAGDVKGLCAQHRRGHVHRPYRRGRPVRDPARPYLRIPAHRHTVAESRRARRRSTGRLAPAPTSPGTPRSGHGPRPGPAARSAPRRRNSTARRRAVTVRQNRLRSARPAANTRYLRVSFRRRRHDASGCRDPRRAIGNAGDTGRFRCRSGEFIARAPTGHGGALGEHQGTASPDRARHRPAGRPATATLVRN